MAGTFGMLESKYALSMQVAEGTMAKIQQQPLAATIVSSGTSCRQQISHLASRRPKHMAEVLAGALRR